MPEDIFFVADGELDVIIGDKETMVIATLRQGDHFGEYGVIYDQPRSASIRAGTFCTLVRLPASALLHALDLYPRSAERVYSYVDDHRRRSFLQEQAALNASGGSEALKLLEQEEAREFPEDDESQQPLNQTPPWTISPASTTYQYWQIAFLIIMCWNAIGLPLRIGWETGIDDHPMVLLLDYAGDLFLLLDIALTFRLRYVQRGSEVSDLTLIRTRYLRGNFGIDVVSSLPLDFFMLIAGRWQPAWRLNRLIRLGRVNNIIRERISMTKRAALLSLGYVVVLFLMLAHYLAMCYFLLARHEGFTPDLPVDPTQPLSYWNPSPNFDKWHPSSVVEHGPLWIQWLHGMWFVTGHLAGVGRHVFPPNDIDVLLTVFVMFMGLFALSYIIGTFSVLIVTLDSVTLAAQAEKVAAITLMDRLSVTTRVQIRVVECIRHAWSMQQGRDANATVKALPPPLRIEIMQVICAKLIRSCTRFTCLTDSCVRHLVGELSFVELPAREYVFMSGEPGDTMYFVARGELEILFELEGTTTSPSNNNNNNTTRITIETHNNNQTQTSKVIGPGSFFGEGTPPATLCVTTAALRKFIFHFSHSLFSLSLSLSLSLFLLCQVCSSPVFVPPLFVAGLLFDSSH